MPLFVMFDSYLTPWHTNIFGYAKRFFHTLICAYDAIGISTSIQYVTII